MRLTLARSAAALATLAFIAVLAAGCGGEGNGSLTPREQSMRITQEGSYQVRGIEDGITQGVGIYSGGSFRIIVEESARMVIFNQESGEAWLVSLTRKSYEPINFDEAILKAGFMPALIMEPYFELEQYWQGEEFRMDTTDGRSIRAFLEGPDYLPSAWVAESQGEPFKEISWEYRRVGEVSPANFMPPEGFALLE